MDINRIYKGVLANYDEILAELETPDISLCVEGFEIPDWVRDQYCLPDNAFVDELYGCLDEVKNGYGLSLCFSVPYEDGEGSERIEDVDIEDLSEEYLTRLADYVETHNGAHIGTLLSPKSVDAYFTNSDLVYRRKLNAIDIANDIVESALLHIDGDYTVSPMANDMVNLAVDEFIKKLNHIVKTIVEPS